MTLAGHSSFETTHKFYLSIKNDYLAKAKRANSEELGRVLVEVEGGREQDEVGLGGGGD